MSTKTKTQALAAAAMLGDAAAATPALAADTQFAVLVLAMPTKSRL